MRVAAILAALMLAIFFIVKSTASKNFSPPVKVGSISVGLQHPAGGFFIKGAKYNDGNYYTRYKANNTFSYGKGTAIFGEGADALYVHYDYDKNGGGNFLSFQTSGVNFGDKDFSNTVALEIGYDGDIQQIKSGFGITFYSIYFGYKYSSFYLIGRSKDGKWAKYLDSREDIEKKFFKPEIEGFLGYWEKPHYLNEISCEGDTIILPYDWINDNKTQGEFRLKWNDNAQKFNVEQVKYSEAQIAEKQKNKAALILDKGEVFYKTGKHREALINYNQAIELSPNLAEAYISRSVVLYVDSRTIGTPADQVKAMDDINRALELNPNSARAYRWRAYMKKWADDKNTALADVDRAIKLNPQYLDAYELRAEIYSDMKKFDLAIADYTFILENPNFKNSYMQHYDFDMMSDWAWYSDWEQRTAALYNSRGTAYYENGERDKAVDDFERALKLSPNNIWIGRAFHGNLQQEIENKKKRGL